MTLLKWAVLLAILLAAGFEARGSTKTKAIGGLPPGPLIIGYQSWEDCNITQTLAIAERGVNVVIWVAINLAKSDDGQPLVQAGPNYTCVAEVRALLNARGLQTAHLISVGGWDAPDPDTTFSGEEWFTAWDSWNKALPQPFDGLDWDLEGNGRASISSNTLTPEVLELVVNMSVALKHEGYIVSMVPAQSYLDVTTDRFNTSLLNAYPDYHPNFHHHGQNCYAYFLAAAPANTFDLVILQLYETWSRADDALQSSGVSPAEYLQSLSAAMINGWEVDFSSPSLRLQGRHVVKVSSQQLIIGLSFGSGDGKSVAILPGWAGQAYTNASVQQRPRGYAFWNIDTDYAGGPWNGTNEKISLTSGLNDFLHVRAIPEMITVAAHERPLLRRDASLVMRW